MDIDELRQHIANFVVPAKLLGLFPIHAGYSSLLCPGASLECGHGMIVFGAGMCEYKHEA
jgi:hypothetical protein